MPLLDVVGKATKLSPLQISATGSNVGVTMAFTVMVKVSVVAHCPAVGVKVYVVVVVLSNAGDHVPVIPFVDVVGNAERLSPLQISATGSKVGVKGVVRIETSIVVVLTQPPDTDGKNK